MTLIEACLNGSRRPDEHPALPLTPAQLAADSRAVVGAGARIVHVHPRDRHGHETLDGDVLRLVVRAIRSSVPGTPVGVTTGAWVETDPERRLAAIRSWTVLPDLASVNLHEPGAVALIRTLVSLGVGVEAGVWSTAGVDLLVNEGLAELCVRILVEVMEQDPVRALLDADRIQGLLDERKVTAPRLLHGMDAAAWPVLDAALEAGLEVRTGLEDTLHDPQGARTLNNATLVRVASERVRAQARG